MDCDVPKPFRNGVSEAVQSLQDAVRQVLASTLEEPAGRVVDIQAELGIDVKLAWKLTNLADQDDPITAARFVPGRAALRRFIEAARSAGAIEGELSSVQEAASVLERFIQDRAGDRRSFDLLTASLVEPSGERHERELRRSGFHASSFIAGVQAEADVTVLGYNVSPSDPSRLDAAIVHGAVGLRQLRPGARWRVGRAYRVGLGRVEADEVEWCPLEGEPVLDTSGTHAIPLLTRFSRGPLPRVGVDVRVGGSVMYEVQPHDLGVRDALDCTIGVRLSAVASRYVVPSVPASARHRSFIRARLPAERLEVITVIPEGLFAGDEPAVAALCDLLGGETARFDEDDRAPIAAMFEPLGSLPARPRAGWWEHTSEAVDLVAGALGMSPAGARVHRMVVEYPHTPMAFRVSWDRRPAPIDG